MRNFKATLRTALLTSTALLSISSVAATVPVGSSDSTGNLMLRFVNAGLPLHAPSVNRLSMTLVAEDDDQRQNSALWRREYTPTTSPYTPTAKPKTQGAEHDGAADEHHPVRPQPQHSCPDGQNCAGSASEPHGAGDVPSHHDQ